MNSKRIVLAVVAGFVMLASAQCQKKEAGPTSTEENKALTDRFAEAWIEGDLAAMDELLAPNFVNHAAVPGVTPDREGYKKFATMHHTGFPDFDVKVEDVVAEGDKVARRVTWTGTHKGNYMGIAPTGKQEGDSDYHRAHRRRQDCRTMGRGEHARSDAAARRYAVTHRGRGTPVATLSVAAG
jgi:predicted ester cyclase